MKRTIKTEISALFGMDYDDDMVRDAHIGDGVYIEEIVLNGKRDELFEQVEAKNIEDYRKLIFREGLEVAARPYTHRFRISVDSVPNGGGGFGRARQLIMRAIVLSRIIKPLPIPLHPTTIVTTDGQSEVEVKTGFYGTAYVVRRLFQETITETDADLMARYWPSSQYFYDNRTRYKRIFRALTTFNDAYHILPSHLSHVVLHAALETLICTSHKNNRNQVVYRLPQLIDGVTENEALEIYHFCADVKHTAAPGLLYSKDSRELDSRDSKRWEAARLLDESVRKILIRALEDRSFAQELEDKAVLEAKYPVPKK